jgi:hypothetical protein
MNVGDYVLVTLHYRARGRLFGWIEQITPGHIVKVNRRTVDVAMTEPRGRIERVKIERVRVVE